MGARGRVERIEYAGSVYTKLLILLVFSPILGLPSSPEKVKIQATLTAMLHRFSFPKKAPNLSSVSL
jgi:hypothetical protein